MTRPLVSLPQLIDDGCKIKLTMHSINIHKNNKEIIQGGRNPITRMWTVPFTVDDDPQNTALHTINVNRDLACNAYTQKSIANLVTYHHITLGSVAPPTLIKAIKSGFHQEWIPHNVSRFKRKSSPKIPPKMDLILHVAH